MHVGRRLALVASAIAMAMPIMQPPLRVASATSPDFSVSFSSIPTIDPGAEASFTATVTPLNGEAGPVTIMPVAGYGLVGAVTASPPVAVVGDATLGAPSWSTQFTLQTNAWLVGSTTYTEEVVAHDANGNVHTYALPFSVGGGCADFSIGAPA